MRCLSKAFLYMFDKAHLRSTQLKNVYKIGFQDKTWKKNIMKSSKSAMTDQCCFKKRIGSQWVPSRLQDQSW